MRDGPNAREMFENLSETARDSFKLLRNKGIFLATDEVVEQRINTCLSCENLFSTAGINRCKVCGCGLLLKIRMAGAACPLKKWERMTGDELRKAGLLD